MILFADVDNNRAALAYQRFSDLERNSTIWCKNTDEVLDILINYDIETAYIGDLHPRNSTGFECKLELIRWMEGQPTGDLEKLRKIQFVLHSWDQFLVYNMKVRMEKLGLKVKTIPFGS